MIRVYASMASVLCGEYVYFSARDFNALMRTNINTRQTEYICCFDKEDKIGELHIKAFLYDNYIWWIPLFGKYVAKFNVETHDIEYFDVMSKMTWRDELEEFCLEKNGEKLIPAFSHAGIIDEKRVYLVPAGENALVILNIENDNMDIFQAGEHTKGLYLGVSCVIGDEIWMAPYLGGEFLSFNISTQTFKKETIPNPVGKYYGMCTDGYRILMTETSRSILAFNPKECCYETIGVPETSEGNVREIGFCNDYVWMLPLDVNSTSIKRLNIGTNTIEEYLMKNEEKMGTVIIIDMKRDYCLFESFTGGFFIKWESNSRDLVKIDISVSDAVIRQIYEDNYNNVLGEASNNGILHEEAMGLNNFIYYLNNKG